MRKYEISFPSVNSETYPKMITALVLEPDSFSSDTGAMLFTHGWGGNRFQHQDKMEFTADKFNLVCVSAEFRQSGYDFDPVKGLGAYLPYDAGFYQVFDVLNALRETLHLRPGVNRERLFHYGGSQGGNIALLSSIFAPDTFAFVYASSPLTHLDEKIRGWAGREFSDYELSARNVIEHAALIKCPVFLEHGTADSTVSVSHTQKLAADLKRLGKKHSVKYYEGGEHDLSPAITKLEAFSSTAPELARTQRRAGEDDFSAGRKVRIQCADKTLLIDWARRSGDTALFQWI